MPEAFAYPQAMSAERLHDAIRKRAEQIYIPSGRTPGRDLENWAQAGWEILLEPEKAERRTAIVLDVNGVPYVGECDPMRAPAISRRVSIRRRALDWF